MEYLLSAQHYPRIWSLLLFLDLGYTYLYFLTPTETPWETSVSFLESLCSETERSLWCISREQKCAGWWLNWVQAALDLSELPTGNSSFLIQMNFCICVILPSTTSIALGQFYSLWKQKVRKESKSVKCTEGRKYQSL